MKMKIINTLTLYNKIFPIAKGNQLNQHSNQKKAQEHERPRRKTANAKQDRDARLCIPGSTVVPPPPRAVADIMGSPWWPLAAATLMLLECCVLCSTSSAGFCLGSSDLGLLGSSATFLDLLGPQLHSFSYYLARHM